MDIALFALAASPLLVILVLIFLFTLPLFEASLFTLVYTTLLAVGYWHVSVFTILGSVSKGFLTGIEIIVIIAGALLFVEFLKKTKRIEKLEHVLSGISTDTRVHIILLVWILGGFLEGTAGFGVPAAVVAPLLVALGIRPVVSVALALIADSSLVPFGAIGTPIRIGLESLPQEYVGMYLGAINLFVGLFVPLMILAVYELSTTRSWSRFKEIIPFALWSGLAVLVPYFFATLVGIEFPSLIGPIVGLIILIISSKFNFCMPGEFKKINLKEAGSVLLPYAILIVLLFVLKSLPSFSIFLLGDLSHKIRLYNPGLLFIITIGIVWLFKRVHWQAKESVRLVSSRLVYPFITIFTLVSFIQIMFNSGMNASNLPSMIAIFSQALFTEYLVFLAPYIGGLGAFISGSATVSTLLFGSVQLTAAIAIGVSVPIILALQITGGAAGNMIALTNIVAAESTVQLKGKEKDIIKLTIIPFVIYVTLAGIVAWLLLLLV